MKIVAVVDGEVGRKRECGNDFQGELNPLLEPRGRGAVVQRERWSREVVRGQVMRLRGRRL